jgi:DNA (cytosine-5)-methyltransferase 1
MKPQVFSFFSGAGFLDLGFETNGFEIAAANEIHEPFANAYRSSRSGMKIDLPSYGLNVDTIESYFEARKLKSLKGQLKEVRRAGQLTGFVGGPPCPDFSVAGKNAGRDGENGRLSKSYIDLVLEAKPDFFLFENVKGLWRTSRHRAFYEELKVELGRAGYSLSERLINSIEYGAPQDRDRIILIGILGANSDVPIGERDWEAHLSFKRDVAFSAPWPDMEAPRKRRSAPSGIIPELTVQYWFDLNDVTNHPNSGDAFKPRAGLERFESTLEGDVSRKSYKRLHRWRYSPTAAYGNNEVHIHPWESRRISVAEALAIQSLPKAFALPENMTLSAKFKSIGNGVPYLAARGLATMLGQALERESR